MSTTEPTTNATATSPAPIEDLKLEAVVIPVVDVDRSKRFYAGLGWRLDADFAFDNGFRVVQFTPPGSPASLQFGTAPPAAPRCVPAPPGARRPPARPRACTWSSPTSPPPPSSCGRAAPRSARCS